MKKVYAVRCGREPGIYETWEACRAQVEGYSGAVFKGFRSREEAEQYMRNETEAGVVPASETVCPEIYVDGSFRSDTGEYSYGQVVLYQGEEYCCKAKFSDPELASMRNVAGEIRGAEEAMRLALKEGWPAIFIYHDYAGIAHWCTGEWKANKPGTIAYRDFYQSIRDRLEVTYVKVKGHSHNRCNDLADKLAKEALGIGI